MSRYCRRCGASLLADDVGIYCKLVSRNASDYLCHVCLAEQLHMSEENILAMIERFREMGCSLFPPKME